MYRTWREVLGDELWEKLCGLAPRLSRPARSVLLRQGDPGTHVLAVSHGSVVATSIGANGVEVLLALRGAGELLGELAVMDGGTRSCTVVTVEPCEVSVILAADFRRFATEHGLLGPLLDHAIKRVREAEEIRFELATAPVSARLASALIRISAITPHIPLTQHELARLIGASRNAVGGVLTRWRTNGWLATNGGLRLTDPAAIRREAGVS